MIWLLCELKAFEIKPEMADTSHVCPQLPVECRVFDLGGIQFFGVKNPSGCQAPEGEEHRCKAASTLSAEASTMRHTAAPEDGWAMKSLSPQQTGPGLKGLLHLRGPLDRVRRVTTPRMELFIPREPRTDCGTIYNSTSFPRFSFEDFSLCRSAATNYATQALQA